MALTLGDNFSYQGAKPLDARLKYDTLAAMKAVADATMYDGCMAYCTATDKTYQWKSTNDVDETTGKWREFTSGGDTIQVDTLPTAGADELGNVYQYIGSTTLTLTHGYFYECVSDGAGTPTYSWEEVSTSKGGHDIKNSGVAVTSRDTMNFTDFDISDDSTNEETDIKAHRLTQAEMSEIMSTLPGAVSDMPVLFDERETEYIIGWYVLANGTKKPVYQKSILTTSPSSTGSTTNIVTLPTNIETVVSLDGVLMRTGFVYPINYINDNSKIVCWLRTSENAIAMNITNADCKSQPVRITLKYTKTTDTPV